MQKPINKFVYWTPRILSIIFIAFLALMSLDVFESGLSFWQTALALFMHNIPALILLIIVIIAWKYEIVGGIGFIFGGVLYATLVLASSPFEWYKPIWILQISGMAFLIGTLFLKNWHQKNLK